MQKGQIIFLILLFTIFVLRVDAQISYGGKPLLMNHSFLRNSQEVPFYSIPSFNVDSVLISDGLNSQMARNSYPFAYKFITDIQKGKDGIEIILPDGTKVWQVGIESEGAYSINLLFTEFDIPPGGKLFIYNRDHTHLIGAFDHRNNSPARILPVRPVAGESIIIEYSEPANAEYEARLVIGEVNHDYRNILESGILKKEPTADLKAYLCMPDALCEDADSINIRATVLLIINGTTSCTGTLINNTEEDGTPYVLTAVHCLNPKTQFPQDFDYYVDKSGTIITFFNYNRSVCGSSMKATENMSTAIAYPRVILERKDIALLELQQRPPLEYNAYYAGWNRSAEANNAPYMNIHHPGGAVKKYGITNKKLTLGSWSETSEYPFDKYSHWVVDSWNKGSTHGGSSGSPLFDSNNLVVGGLTGGLSACNNTSPNFQPDYFFALYKGWETENKDNQLKTYLDPVNRGVISLKGWDPYKNNPLIRLSNMQLNNSDTLGTVEYKEPNNGYVFGNSNLKILEFAEEFKQDTTSVLYGVYIFIPAMPYTYTSDVIINVYSGKDYPESLLGSQTFTPQYLNYRTLTGGSQEDFVLDPINTRSTPTEHFIKFDKPIYLGKKFFISYRINYSEKTNRFVIYNSGSINEIKNTAWLKNENDEWIRANNYSVQPIATSLALQPLIQHNNIVSIPPLVENRNKLFIYNRMENLLFIPEVKTDALISIYSINGQMIEEHFIAAGQKYISLIPSVKGTIGIVRLFTREEVYTGKIIY